MATRTATPVPLTPGYANTSVQVFQWTGLLNGDDGEPVALPGYEQVSVQVEGTPGVGFAARWEGSNDGAVAGATPTYEPLTAADFAAVGIKPTIAPAYLQRPRITAGDGTTAIVVTAVFTRTL